MGEPEDETGSDGGRCGVWRRLGCAGGVCARLCRKRFRLRRVAPDNFVANGKTNRSRESRRRINRPPSAQYSALGERVRTAAPRALQCALFCGGARCIYERPSRPDNAIQGLYSDWITDEILAMARPSTAGIAARNIIQQFHSWGIRTVVNLQTPGEHASCGSPLTSSGFTYDPNVFMANDIYYYNFAWADYGEASLAGLLDMTKVLSFAIREGRVAIHCHAGLGRTGVLIACYLVYSLRVRANDAIRLVRRRRPHSVQTSGQILCVQQFEHYLLPQTVVFSSKMEEEIVVKQGNKLKINFKVDCSNFTRYNTLMSQEYAMSDVAIFQVKVLAATWVDNTIFSNNTHLFLIFIKFQKKKDYDITCQINFTSEKLGITNKPFVSDDGTWRLVHEANKAYNRWEYFDVTIDHHNLPDPRSSAFETLHEDIELTDFELRAEDGSVRFHKAVLAASSPVFQRMLSGKWKETSEGHVEVPGTSKATLQSFKDYIYLHILPESGVEQILLLASCYMMPELEQLCSNKLVGTLTAQNAYDRMEFAIAHKLKRLLLAILQCVQDKVITMQDMRECFLGEE